MKRSAWVMAMALLASCGIPDYGVREPVPADMVHVEPREPGAPQPRAPMKPMEPKPAAVVEWELALPRGTLEAQMAADYLADAGDVLSILFATHPKLTQDAQVTPDGSLVLAQLGTLQVRGKTLMEIQTSVVDMAVSMGIRNPKVSVAVKLVAKKFVTMVGTGLSGGRVEIQGKGTVLETLAGSTWKPDRRANRSVALVRNGRTSVIDMDQITGRSNMPLNIKLQANDILVLMDQEPFEMKGAVNNPGTYAIPARGDISLRDALALSGGVKYPVDLSAVQIMRASGKSEIFDLNDYFFGKNQNPDQVLLRAGDTVWLPPAREIGVFVLGMVNKPGLHRVAGPVTVSRALALADNLKFGAVLGDSRLVRGYPSKAEVVRVNFDKVFGGDPVANLAMNDGDVLFIPESWGSDVLDTVGRILGPISGAVPVSAQIYTATQIGK